MRKLLGMFSAIALFAMVGLNACNDEGDSESCQNGTFEMTINGESFTGKSFNNTLLKATGAKRLDIRATNADGKMIIITATDLTSGTSGNGITTEDDYTPYSEVVTGTENVFLFTIIQDNVSNSFIDGTLDITSCDADNKQISGTFSFSDGDIEVTNGSFTNMCYRIVK